MADEERKRPADAIDLTEEGASQEKKMRASINDVVADLRCPITQELPFDPVMAKDGKIYEREAILKWFRQKDGDATSPSTGKVIDVELVPAVQVRNTIETLIKSGAIEGELAEAWTKKLELAKEVKEIRAKAEGGDGGAMYNIGIYYEYGMNGVAQDIAQARAWYERGAAVRDRSCLAKMGMRQVIGLDGPPNIGLGILNITEAAHLGSDYGAFLLGEWFFKGELGLPKDPARARFWLQQVANDECKSRIYPSGPAEAAEYLRELDNA